MALEVSLEGFPTDPLMHYAKLSACFASDIEEAYEHVMFGKWDREPLEDSFVEHAELLKKTTEMVALILERGDRQRIASLVSGLAVVWKASPWDYEELQGMSIPDAVLRPPAIVRYRGWFHAYPKEEIEHISQAAMQASVALVADLPEH